MKKIQRSKKGLFLPQSGQKVKTKIKLSSNSDFLLLVKDKYISNRRNGDGIYIDFIANSGGDWWWIKHLDNTVGVYQNTEVFDR